MDVTSPDEKSVITYVSTLYDVFPKVPEGVEGIGANVSKEQQDLRSTTCDVYYEKSMGVSNI